MHRFPGAMQQGVRRPLFWYCKEYPLHLCRWYNTSRSRSPAQRIAYQLGHDPKFAKELLEEFTPEECQHLAQQLELVPPAPPPSASDSEQTGNSTTGTTQAVKKLTAYQIKWLFLRQFVPFIAFGATSNAILLLTGDAIDRTLGVALGLTALCSAGLANAVSDTVGMLSTAPIQRLTDKLNFPDPGTTPDQESSANTVSSAGQILGMVLGCLLGMLALFFIHDRQSLVDSINVALSPEQRLRMTKAMKKTSYSEGEYLQQYGTPGDWLHVIVDGEADIIARDATGKPIKVGTLKGGDVVGELEIINGHPCIADIVATTPVLTQKIHREDVLTCMGPALAVLKDHSSHEQSYAWYRARLPGGNTKPSHATTT